MLFFPQGSDETTSLSARRFGGDLVQTCGMMASGLQQVSGGSNERARVPSVSNDSSCTDWSSRCQDPDGEASQLRFAPLSHAPVCVSSSRKVRQNHLTPAGYR